MLAAEAFDRTLSCLRQAQELSPGSTPRHVSSHSGDERWADIAVDHVAGYEIEVRQEQTHFKVDDTVVLYPTEVSPEDLNSVGSRFHDSGRCKPCAFFHTKGCQSGAECLFCHRCPAHEKQRRKRLRRQICHSLLSPFDARGCRTQESARPSHPKKAGHSRMMSSDTVSTCSGWISNPEDQFAHSRTTSTSSQASPAYENGEAVRGHAYQTAQPVMMSPTNSMQQVMPVMRPCDEYRSEIGPNEDLHTVPVLEGQRVNLHAIFSGNEEAFPMPPTSAANVPNLTRREPPPPPPGMPTVTMPQTQPGMAQMPMSQPAPPSAWPAPAQHSQPQSPSNGSEQMQLSLPVGAVTGHYEQQRVQPVQCAGLPHSPVGYMTCGNTQYALMAVPMQQCDNSPTYNMSPTYQPAPQEQRQQQQLLQHPQQTQQSWGQFQAGPAYQSDQQWSAPYECSAVMAGGSDQWW